MVGAIINEFNSLISLLSVSLLVHRNAGALYALVLSPAHLYVAMSFLENLSGVSWSLDTNIMYSAKRESFISSLPF